MKILISGPMTEPERFEEVEALIRMTNDEAINPFNYPISNQLFDNTWKYLMDLCDCVYMLEGYSKSRRCNEEIKYARKKNKTVLFEKDFKETPDDMMAKLKTGVCDGLCGKAGDCDLCFTKIYLNRLGRYIKAMKKELQEYKDTELTPQDIREIDEEYRNIAKKLSVTEDKINRLRELTNNEIELVNHPKHYNQNGKKECWDEMEEKFGGSATVIFDCLSAYKYKYRAGFKADNPKEQDMRKINAYMEHAKSIIDQAPSYNPVSAKARKVYNKMLELLEDK